MTVLTPSAYLIFGQPIGSVNLLKSVDVSQVDNGVIRNVENIGLFQYQSGSTATPDNITVIEPNSGGGRWLNITMTVSTSSVLVGRASSGGGIVAEIPFSTFLQTSNNLSDILDTATARTNLNVPTRTGGNASGTWGISISGNAATVTTNANLTGDVVSVGNATAISNQAVTFAKFQNISTGVLLGRSTASTGSVEQISIGAGLLLSGGTLSATDAGGTVTSFSAGNLSPLFTTSVATGTTTPALSFALSNAAANTYFGNATGTPGAPSYTAAGALTKVDDTNVTLTLGANASTSLLRDVSLTLGWTGQLPEPRGGTGQSTYAQGDILYASAINTLAKLPKDTNATRYLSNTGTSNNPVWAQINLSNGVTGDLPVGNLNSGAGASATTFWRGDGTWATPIDTVGVASATGTANQVLVNGLSGSAQTGACTFTLPQDIGTSSSVTFGQITVDNLNLNGNTLSATDAAGNLILDTNGGAIYALDNFCSGAAGTALTSGITSSRSSNPRVWLYETGASTNNKVWEHLANSGTYRFRVATDDLTNSVSIYDVTRSGISSLVMTIPTATLTVNSQLNVDNLRLDGNTFSSTNTNGDINLYPDGTGQVVLSGASNVYRQIKMGGGNQYGFIWGSFPGTSDGICLSYNFYYNSSGTGVIGTTGGGTAYIQVGYGDIKFYAAAAGAGNPTQKAYMQDNGNWIYQGSGYYQDNKYIYFGTGSDSRIGYDGTNTIWNLQDAGSGGLFFQINDTRTTGGLELVQYGSGDSAFTWTISGATNFIAGLDNSDSDKWKLCASGNIGTNDSIVVTTAGQVTMPLQPSFYAYRNTSVPDVTGDGTEYFVLYTGERWDIGSNFVHTTGIFTAPVTGTYQFSGMVTYYDQATGHTDGFLLLNINSGTRYVALDYSPTGFFASVAIGATGNALAPALEGTAYVQLTAGDTVKMAFQINQDTPNPGKIIDVYGDGNIDMTYFTGSLIS